ncbi:MAG: hypothetical protein LBT84_06660 [Spirochaetia bacterium]|jgi:hypothetical protein|nr:hypothetical protein [Spirochaetia bacterium]
MTEFFFVLLTFFLASAGESNDFLKIEGKVNRTTVTAGETVEYTVTVAGTNLEDVDLRLPEERGLYIKDEPVPVYIISSASKEPAEGALAAAINISFYRPGTWRLPELEIYGSDKIRVTYNVPEITVAPSNENGEFAEAEPPFEIGGNYTRIAWLIAGGLLAAVAVFFIWRYVKKKRESRAASAPVNPFDLFTRELEEMGGGALIDEGKIDEYAFGISVIFRRFLSRRFGFDAAEMTTGEIRSHLSKAFRSSDHAPLLNEVIAQFDLWDLSKFAEFTPAASTMLQSHSNIIQTAKRLARGWDDGTV